MVELDAFLKKPVVLVVEDEPFIRLDAADIIRRAGFDVVEVTNADEAIKVLEHRCDITLVFTDVQMPGSMDGLKLAHAVRNRWPPVLIVATSGNVSVRLEHLPDGGRFLPKPYNALQLTAVFRELHSLS